jgi:hypothetical protein
VVVGVTVGVLEFLLRILDYLHSHKARSLGKPEKYKKGYGTIIQDREDNKKNREEIKRVE